MQRSKNPYLPKESVANGGDRAEKTCLDTSHVGLKKWSHAIALECVDSVVKRHLFTNRRLVVSSVRLASVRAVSDRISS